MQASRAAAFSGNHVTLGSFEVGGRVYALDVSQLREVVRWRAITPLPGAPPLLEGVIDLRGTAVPVVDLGRLVAGKPVGASPRARIAVAEVEGLLLGLAVDAALEVSAVDVARLEDPPALLAQTGHDAVRALVRRAEGEPVLVLSLEHLLERIYRSALPEGEA